jgi:hypothetical protein
VRDGEMAVSACLDLGPTPLDGSGTDREFALRFDTPVDPTDARKPTVRRFGRSHRRAQRFGV